MLFSTHSQFSGYYHSTCQDLNIPLNKTSPKWGPSFLMTRSPPHENLILPSRTFCVHSKCLAIAYVISYTQTGPFSTNQIPRAPLVFQTTKLSLHFCKYTWFNIYSLLLRSTSLPPLTLSPSSFSLFFLSLSLKHTEASSLKRYSKCFDQLNFSP